MSQSKIKRSGTDRKELKIIYKLLCNLNSNSCKFRNYFQGLLDLRMMSSERQIVVADLSLLIIIIIIIIIIILSLLLSFTAYAGSI